MGDEQQSNFIREIIDLDLKQDKNDYDGAKCNLRFDDTNPVKEGDEYVNSIIEDVKWLGFNVENNILYASD